VYVTRQFNNEPQNSELSEAFFRYFGFEVSDYHSNTGKIRWNVVTMGKPNHHMLAIPTFKMYNIVQYKKYEN
jgi:hypothetical protein